MKNKIKKAAALILAAVMIFLLTACGGDDTPVVMELDGSCVTAAMYHYWASRAKGEYIYSYEDVNNTSECWAAELKDGVTVGEYFDSVTLTTVKENLVAMKLFEDYGLKITASEKKGVSEYVGDIVKEYADGDEKMMNTVLSEYGINTDILKKIYLEDTKSTKVFDYLYGEGGKTPVTREEYEKAYMDGYVHFQLIYINNAYQYVTDSEGNKVTDDDGVYKTEALDSAVKAEKDKLVAEVEKKLRDGGDFYSLYGEYSEVTDYENGYYYPVNEMYGDEVFYKLTAAAVKLKTGETEKVETDSGTCFISKLDNDGGAWEKSENADFFGEFKDSVKETAFRELLKTYFDKITVDEEAIKEFSVTKITPAYSF